MPPWRPDKPKLRLRRFKEDEEGEGDEYRMGGGGPVQKIGLMAQQDDIEHSNSVQEINIEELGELTMPEQTQNRLTKLFDHWSTKFATLSEELDQAVAESRATGEQIDKNLQERLKLFEAGLPRQK